MSDFMKEPYENCAKGDLCPNKSNCPGNSCANFSPIGKVDVDPLAGVSIPSEQFAFNPCGAPC